MPIKDIQPQEPTLARLGVIRLGVKKVSNNSGKEYPTESDHFVLRDAPELTTVYGTEPRTLLIYLAHASVDDNLIAYHELWSGGGLMCRGDGETIQQLVNPNNGEVVVRQGLSVTTFSDSSQEWAEGETLPCPGMAHDRYPRCAKCKPHGLLKVMVRDPGNPSQLVTNRLGYYQLRTSSILNIRDLTGQLRFIEQIARYMGKDLRGVPCILQRVQRTIPYTDEKDGQRKQIDKWFLSIEVDPRWVAVAAPAMEAHALGTGFVTPSLPELVGNGEEPIDGEVEDVPWTDAPEMTQRLADLGAMRDDVPRTLPEALSRLADVMGTAWEEKSFVLAVRQRLGLSRTDPFPFTQKAWIYMVQELQERLGAIDE